MRLFPSCGGLKTSESHLTSLTTNLKTQRKQNCNYCDITLICGGTRLSAHKTILVAASPYFECLIEGHFAESKSNEVDLTAAMAGDPETLENILDFIYTGKLLIQGNNFRNLLDACSMLLLNGAIELLTEYLKDSLVIVNCLEIFELAFKYSLKDISQVCISMIKSRMRDYFCHGERLFSVPPDIFLYLCKQNVFFHLSKEHTQVLIKEYTQNLKDLDQAENFKEWMDKERVSKECVPGSIPPDENQSDEILLIRCKESKKKVKLLGWLAKSSKWINLGSVDGSEVGFYKLGPCFGFAEEFMVFEIRDKEEIYKRNPFYLAGWDDIDLLLVPLDPAQRERADCIRVKTACDFCSHVCLDDFDHGCPHKYFTVDNMLYCVAARVEVYEPEDRDDVEERFRLSYEINRYSVEEREWFELGGLKIPRVYYHQQDADWHERPEEVRYVDFKIVNMKTHILFVMVNLDEDCRRSAEHYYLTVIRLTLDIYNDTFQSKVIFHKRIEVEDVGFYRDASVTAVSSNLRFQKISGLTEEHNGRITEVHLSNGKLQELKLGEDFKLTLPESDYDYFRSHHSTDKFVASGENGRLHHVDNVLPYINRMWSYDMMREDWKSFPGPPRDQEIIGANFQYIPVDLDIEIDENPAALFEDTHENVDHGPFLGKKISCT